MSMYIYMYIIILKGSHEHAEGRGFKSHPRQFFFETLLSWDLICTCMSLLYLSQVSEYLSRTL